MALNSAYYICYDHIFLRFFANFAENLNQWYDQLLAKTALSGVKTLFLSTIFVELKKIITLNWLNIDFVRKSFSITNKGLMCYLCN
jgi:hypothetical protein